ncbi:MAG: class I SAM-dependent methyltransferase [Pseudomonadales bacterium]
MNPQSQHAELSTSTAEELFFDRVAQIVDAGAVSIMLSIGHRLGLFDTLAKLPPSTSAQIAEAGELAERYVREWLAVMVVADIIVYDAVSKTYQLPAEHAACLTRNAPAGNLAVYAQFVAMAGATEVPLLECFETGEGLSYADYPCFHQIMSEDSNQTVAANVGNILAELSPEMSSRLEKGIDVLDAGCGLGMTLVAMAKLFPSSRFTGYDLCADVISSARQAAFRQGLDNVHFDVVDLASWETSSEFDLITSFDAVHDTSDPQELLKRVHAALRPSGVHLMQDIGGSAHLENNRDFPFAALLYTMSTVHCTPVSLAQNGKGLGTMWGWETAERMLQAAGFQHIERHVVPDDPMNVWFVSRKSAQSHD